MAFQWLAAAFTLGGYLALVGVFCEIIYAGAMEQVERGGRRDPDAGSARDAEELQEPAV